MILFANVIAPLVAPQIHVARVHPKREDEQAPGNGRGYSKKGQGNLRDLKKNQQRSWYSLVSSPLYQDIVYQRLKCKLQQTAANKSLQRLC